MDPCTGGPAPLNCSFRAGRFNLAVVQLTLSLGRLCVPDVGLVRFLRSASTLSYLDGRVINHERTSQSPMSTACTDL